MSVQSLDNKRIMLIGGAGFIGHNLALHLKSLGSDVCIVDGLEVNNIMAFSSDDVEAKNRELCLGILHERLNLLRMLPLLQECCVPQSCNGLGKPHLFATHCLLAPEGGTYAVQHGTRSSDSAAPPFTPIALCNG